MNSLKGSFLLAMPQLEDPHFGGSLTYLCEHSDEGALGLIVNKPLDMTLADLLEQMSLPCPREVTSLQPVYRGGPVHSDRGFVLHTGAPEWKSSLAVNEALSLTTSADILEALSVGQGPSQYLVMLGCAGWESQQLEAEIKANAWLTCAAEQAILFEVPTAERLTAAAASLGVDLSTLSAVAGHA